MKKILVPTDFSVPAQRALETAVSMARITRSELLLLHVVNQPTSESYDVGGEVINGENWGDRLFTLKLIEKSKGQLSKIAEFVTQSGVAVKTEIRMGNAFHGIHTLISEQEVDLVVMGTDGHTRLDKMLVGSNTEKVVRHAKCPVLTIHRKPVETEFRNIVYATSMMEDEDKFSGVVAQIQELFKAKLHIVWINTPDSFQPDGNIKRSMQDFANRLSLTNYTLNVFNDYTTREGIVQFAESINADLIAMATHGRTGLAHVFSGSIAEEVSGHSRIPVLTSVLR